MIFSDFYLLIFLLNSSTKYDNNTYFIGYHIGYHIGIAHRVLSIINFIIPLT